MPPPSGNFKVSSPLAFKNITDEYTLRSYVTHLHATIVGAFLLVPPPSGNFKVSSPLAFKNIVDEYTLRSYVTYLHAIIVGAFLLHVVRWTNKKSIIIITKLLYLCINIIKITMFFLNRSQ